jgi:hypothetical protein
VRFVSLQRTLWTDLCHSSIMTRSHPTKYRVSNVKCRHISIFSKKIAVILPGDCLQHHVVYIQTQMFSISFISRDYVPLQPPCQIFVGRSAWSGQSIICHHHWSEEVTDAQSFKVSTKLNMYVPMATAAVDMSFSLLECATKQLHFRLVLCELALRTNGRNKRMVKHLSVERVNFLIEFRDCRRVTEDLWFLCWRRGILFRSRPPLVRPSRGCSLLHLPEQPRSVPDLGAHGIAIPGTESPVTSPAVTTTATSTASSASDAAASKSTASISLASESSVCGAG